MSDADLQSKNEESKNLIEPSERPARRRVPLRQQLEMRYNNEIDEEESVGVRSPPVRQSHESLPRDEQTEVNEQQDRPVRKTRKSKSKATAETGGQVNEAFEMETIKPQRDEEENEENKDAGVRKRKTRKRRTTEVEKDSNQPEQAVPAPHIEDKNILAVVIHQTDKLRTDINIYKPVVRVHILDLDLDGQYVKKTQRDRNLLIYYEKDNRKLEYVSPITTSPFDFKVYQSIIPKWEEKLIFNEEFSHFTKAKPNTLIMFEVLDLPRDYQQDSQTTLYTSQDTSNKWQRIAWAFLKVVGSDGSLNIEKKIRLQLYYSQAKYRFNQFDSLVPEVYSLYKNASRIGSRVKYPASLYVTVKAILAPKSFLPGIGSSYLLNDADAMMSARDRDAAGDEMNTDDETAIDKKEDKELKQKNVIWSRINGMPCRIPNDMLLKLKTGKNGCYSVQFSATGSYIACAAVADDNMYPIYVYDIPSGNRVFKFVGHFGLVYDMSWSKLDKFIVTASNDATARVIDVENRAKDTFKLLPHPTFIYSAKFHPNSQEIVCTSGFDKVIRIWSIKTASTDPHGQLLQELSGHRGYINSLCFTDNGQYLYSADSEGAILEWKCYMSKDEKTPSFQKWELKQDIKVDELNKQCISYVHLHPSQFRMVVHLRNNELKLVDLRLKTVVMRYKGSYTFSQNLKSAMTPCGTFLFCCGADTSICCWNVALGEQITTARLHLDFIKPARDISFHPYDNFIAFCSQESGAPVYVYAFNADKANREMGLAGLNLRIVEPNVSADHEFLAAKDQLESAREAKMLKNIKQDKRVDFAHLMGHNQPAPQTSAATITLSMMDPNIRPEFKYKGPKEAQDIVVALYDYRAQRSDELDIDVGDDILVLLKENENWWMGQLVKSGREGYFPAGYVQEKKLEAGKILPIRDAANKKKYTARDLVSDYQRGYNQDPIDALRKPAENLNDLEAKTNLVIQSLSSNKKPGAAVTKQPGGVNKAPDQSAIEMETVNEVPTKDDDNSEFMSGPRRVKNIKRRAFGHVIGEETIKL